MNNDLQKEIVELAKKQQEKQLATAEFIKGLIIALVINVVLTGIIILSTAFGEGELDLSAWLKLISDAFAIPGLFTLLLYLLVWVSQKGAFDAISYSVQLAFVTIFHKDTKEAHLPATYAEYCELKHKEKKKDSSYLLISGGSFLVIGIIVMIVFYFTI